MPNSEGAILTKMDGDSRGGAALSVYEVSKKPIKFVGTGERLDSLEAFYPDRMARRILGMGDMLTLYEKAETVIKVKDGDVAFIGFLRPGRRSCRNDEENDERQIRFQRFYQTIRNGDAHGNHEQRHENDARNVFDYRKAVVRSREAIQDLRFSDQIHA